MTAEIMPTVLITGAAGGLGKQLARVFSAAQYELLLHYHKQKIDEEYENATCFRGDLLRDIPTLVSMIENKKKDVNVLIHNAGIYLKEGAFETIRKDDIAEVINTNLWAPIRLTLDLWPLLCRNHTTVVFINSLAGKVGSKNETIYCSSKHGLRGFANALRYDAAMNGVRIMSVFAGAMKTEMTRWRHDWDQLMDPAEVARIIWELCETDYSIGVNEIELSRT